MVYEKIPLLEEQDMKQAYQKELQDRLGSESPWNVSIAGFTQGLIISPKQGLKIQDNGSGGVGRMYVLGYTDRRGIGLVTDCDIRETDFFKTLTEKREYNVILNRFTMSIEKPLDTTEEVISEIKKLEELVFA